MRSVRRRDTAPEMALRRALWRRGLRYRVHAACAGACHPDILFPACRVAVFVDGCFWHMCPSHATFPSSNGEWWAEKLAANVERDRRHDSRLRDAGYTVVRVWEHEDPERAACRISELVREIGLGADQLGTD